MFQKRIRDHIGEIYRESREIAESFHLNREIRELEKFYKTMINELNSDSIEKSFSLYGDAYNSFRLMEQKIKIKMKKYEGYKL